MKSGKTVDIICEPENLSLFFTFPAQTRIGLIKFNGTIIFELTL